MATRIVIGTGTGRCGTVTLAKLFGAQLNCISTHEDHPLLPWERNIEDFHIKCDLVSTRPCGIAASVGMDWARYIDNLFERFGDGARVVVLERDIEEVVESYMKKTGGERYRNHWTREDDPMRKMPPMIWDHVYPKYDDIPPCRKRDAIARYCEDLHRQIPDDGRVLRIDYNLALNCARHQDTMLQFCGFAHPVLMTNSINNATVK